MKTFNQVVNQATVRDGSLKSGLALTKLAQANLDVQLSGSIVVEGKELEMAAVLGAALLPAYDAKYSVELNDLLDLYSGGYIAAIQRQIANAGISGTSKKIITAGSLMTAQEYLEGNLRTATIDCLSLYKDIEQVLSEPTREKLVQFLEQVKLSILPANVVETYNIKLEKEQELKSQFEKLAAIGFDNITPTALGNFNAVLSLANANNLAQLSALGYVLIDSSVDIATSSIKVTFKAGEQGKIA